MKVTLAILLILVALVSFHYIAAHSNGCREESTLDGQFLWVSGREGAGFAGVAVLTSVDALPVPSESSVLGVLIDVHLLRRATTHDIDKLLSYYSDGKALVALVEGIAPNIVVDRLGIDARHEYGASTLLADGVVRLADGSCHTIKMTKKRQGVITGCFLQSIAD